VLDAKTLKAIPTTGAILCGIGLAFGDFIARNPCIVFGAVSALLGVFFVLWAGFYRLALWAQREQRLF